MTRISLIGTVHAESGRANVSALVAILERIRPEVIFLELPVDAFEDQYHLAHRHFESTAIRQYQANYQVIVEPVDLPKPDERFISENDDFGRQIERTSYQFRSLVDVHSQKVSAYGFTYLNSADCAQSWSEIHLETLETIKWTGSHRLEKHYREGMQTHESRETAMLKKIYAYCELHPVSTGVFLVGAAHRQPIIDKIGVHTRTTIQWDFSEFLGNQPNS